MDVIKAVYNEGRFKVLDTIPTLVENQIVELSVRSLPPVTSYPNIMHGKPCLTGTRMPVDWLMGYLEGGYTVE